MKANELRIGNLVNIGYDASIARLMENSCYINTHKSEKILIEFRYDRLRPIPLDEAWLIKMGFKFSGTVQQLNYVRLNYEDGGKLFYYSHPLLKIQIISVHQLQNLYFALTGEELNIVLNEIKSPN